MSEVLHPLITVYTSNNPLDTTLWQACFVVSGSRKVVGLSFSIMIWKMFFEKNTGKCMPIQDLCFLSEKRNVLCAMWNYLIWRSFVFPQLSAFVSISFYDLLFFYPFLPSILSKKLVISHDSRLIICLFWMRHQQVSKTGNWLDGANVIQLRR